MAHETDDMIIVLADYYFALGCLMNQVLYDRPWSQTVASDIESATDLARIGLTAVLMTKMHCNADFPKLFRSDFDRTIEFVKKLSRFKEVPEEEKNNLLAQANAHQDYLQSQFTGYLGMFARLSRGT